MHNIIQPKQRIHLIWEKIESQKKKEKYHDIIKTLCINNFNFMCESTNFCM